MKYKEMLGDESMSEAFLPSSSSNNNNNNTNGRGTNTASYDTNNHGQIKRIITLYDPESMLEITATVAAGYVTLLSGGGTNVLPKTGRGGVEQPQAKQQRHQQQNNDEAIALALAAVVDGNVVDICFGVRGGIKPSSSSSSSSSSQAKQTIHERMVKDAKIAIGDAILLNDNIKVSIVQCYMKGFQIIIDSRTKIKKLNIITRCFHSKKVRNDTLTALQACFGAMERSIQDLLASSTTTPFGSN